jgi:hypothetical protein
LSKTTTSKGHQQNANHVLVTSMATVKKGKEADIYFTNAQETIKPFLTKTQQEKGQRNDSKNGQCRAGEGPYRMVGAPGLWK